MESPGWRVVGPADVLCADLRIHEDTERGDNESIKRVGKKNSLAPGDGCCGGSSTAKSA